MRYRKKPVIIEATRWFKNGDHPDDYKSDMPEIIDGELTTISGPRRRDLAWEGEVVRYFRHPGIPGADKCAICGNIMHVHGWIDTLEGGHIVCPGDWIITGVKGERYPCKPDIFEATYDHVAGDTPTP
jgi:hypothetical protein